MVTNKEKEVKSQFDIKKYAQIGILVLMAIAGTNADRIIVMPDDLKEYVTKKEFEEFKDTLKGSHVEQPLKEPEIKEELHKLLKEGAGLGEN